MHRFRLCILLLIAAVAPLLQAQTGADQGQATAAPAPATVLSPDDQAVAQRLRAHVEKMRDTGATALQLRDLNLAEGVAQFYEKRNFAPAWTDAGRIDSLLQELANTIDDGLDPADYHLAELQQQRAALNANRGDPQQRAEFELLATNGYLRALAHLFRGKVNPATLSSEWNFALHDIATAEAMEIVNSAVDSGDIVAVFNRARPQHPLYGKARSALQRLRAIAAQGGWPQLDNSVLKPGDRSAQVAPLRLRLQAAGLLPATPAHSATAEADADVYDDALVAAVKQFQREQYLDDDGVIGGGTRAALNVPVQTRIDQLRVNLERGRWLLHELHDNFVLVDVAGYKVHFYKNGQRAWSANVQVGKPYRSTPIFKSNVTYITFNPPWTVPPTILRNDILPKVRRDSGYLARNNIRVLNSAGRELAPADVDWNNPGGIVLRQDAGPDASLGQVAIRFPNSYAVYLHDTPHRDLFSSDQRAFSSGCIRVERPLELVELLLDDSVNWNRAAIDAVIAAGKTRNVDLAKRVPILLAYWTIDVYDADRVAFKPDIYSRDGAELKALNKRQS